MPISSLTSSGPTPAPVVVDVQTGAWEVLTELVVPLIGAFGSIVVAVVAVWVTLRLARVERRERARSSRIEYAQSVDRSLARLSREIDDGRRLTRPEANDALGRTLHEIRIAMQLTDAPEEQRVEIARWMRAEVSRALAPIVNNSVTRDDAAQRQSQMRRDLSVPLMEWARSGRWVDPRIVRE